MREEGPLASPVHAVQKGVPMDANCSRCGTEIAPHWIFCPHCGEHVPQESHKAEPQQQEHIPARGAFGGLLYGLIAAPILITAGIMISLTGWGVFFGVPIIIMGILAPLAGPLFGMGKHKGKCPACGTVVITVGDGNVHDCPTCSAKFAVGEHAAAGVR
jgi:uncharacterized Zn finger protein (UPF0148 family)